MVGLFSRFSVRGVYRRSQSALDPREIVLPPVSEPTIATNGIEIAFDFKPVERLSEPLDNDQPIQCPLPEPSILNDGRIWKERVSCGVQRRADVGVTSSVEHDSDLSIKKLRPPSDRVILPSVSAPEHNMLKLLDECNAASI